jgi:hypothetical protein
MKNSSGFAARTGLEGNKSLGMSALISTEKSKSQQMAHRALDLCALEEVLDKAEFAGAGLKAKKSMGADWTPQLQEKFKNIMMKL